jgi:flagellar motor switch protein FliN/FliY
MKVAEEAPVVEATLDPVPAAKQPTGAGPAGMLFDVNLQISVELGRTVLPIKDVLRLGPGSVVELSKSVGDPVDVFANDKLIARGELVVVDSIVAVRITQLVGAPQGAGH